MKEPTEKWIDDVLGSMEGAKRATPPLDLFAKIEQQIDDSRSKTISIGLWRKVAAVAILLIGINVYAMQQYRQNQSTYSTEMSSSDDSNQYLMSNYNIYE